MYTSCSTSTSTSDAVGFPKSPTISILSDLRSLDELDLRFEMEGLSATEKEIVNFVPSAIQQAESELRLMKAKAWKRNRIRISESLNDSGYFDDTHGIESRISSRFLEDKSSDVKRIKVVCETAGGGRREYKLPVAEMTPVTVEPCHRDFIEIERSINLHPDDDTDSLEVTVPEEHELMKQQNNELFLLVCQRLIEKETSLKGLDLVATNEIRKWFTFQAIVRWTQSIGTLSNDLESRYYDLLNNETSKSVKLDLAKLRSVLNPPSVSSRTEVMSSFHKHFCRRCYVYNCLNHGKYDNLTTSSKCPTQRPRFDERLLQRGHEDKNHRFKEPCGENCYKPELTKLEKTDLNEDCAIGWTEDEIDIFLAVGKILIANPCKVSNVIMTKTCIQVYKYWQFFKRNGDFDLNGATPRVKKKLRYADTTRKFSNNSKKANLLLTMKDEVKPGALDYPAYRPCYHPGLSCEKAGQYCDCRKGKLTCEKFCCCAADNYQCTIFFPGCRCKNDCGKHCDCVIAARECDVDICGCAMKNCRANPEVGQLCANSNMQRRSCGPKTVVAASTVPGAGLGLFADQPIKAEAYVGEYIGELIGQRETERRGEKYDRIGYTYMFDKDKEHTVDGWQYGNKIRFINSAPSRKVNLNPTYKTVYGDRRIAMYAIRDIQPGEELFFNYESALKKQAANREEDIFRNSFPHKMANASTDESHSQKDHMPTARKSGNYNYLREK